MPLVADDVVTPALFADLCEEVKLGIMEVLTAELVPALPVVPGEKVPVVKNRRIIDASPESWAAKLKSPRHIEGTGENTVEKVHAVMVGYGGLDTRSDDNTVGRKGFRLRFIIDSYYEDEIGEDDDNPEKRHAAEVARVAYVLFASRVLNRPGVVKRVVDFNERRGFTRMGESVMRESLGEVYVELNAVPLVKPA